MEEYYNNYLINSACYKNLNSAITNTNTQIEHVKQLITAFSNASGNNIDLIKIDLDGIQSDLTSYASMLQGILNQLVANANKFDRVLKEQKANIGKDYKAPEVRPGLQTQGVKLDPPVYYEKIGNVSVNENGYINVTVKRYLKFDVITDNSNPNSKETRREDYGDSVYEVKF